MKRFFALSLAVVLSLSTLVFADEPVAEQEETIVITAENNDAAETEETAGEETEDAAEADKAADEAEENADTEETSEATTEEITEDTAEETAEEVPVEVQASSTQVTQDNIVYEVYASDGYARVNSYTGSPVNVNIASSIQGYPVTCIAPEAFRGCITLQSVDIPSSVRWL